MKTYFDEYEIKYISSKNLMHIPLFSAQAFIKIHFVVQEINMQKDRRTNVLSPLRFHFAEFLNRTHTNKHAFDDNIHLELETQIN